jgi:hypothetical protein
MANKKCEVVASGGVLFKRVKMRDGGYKNVEVKKREAYLICFSLYSDNILSLMSVILKSFK